PPSLSPLSLQTLFRSGKPTLPLEGVGPLSHTRGTQCRRAPLPSGAASCSFSFRVCATSVAPGPSTSEGAPPPTMVGATNVYRSPDRESTRLHSSHERH